MKLLLLTLLLFTSGRSQSLDGIYGASQHYGMLEINTTPNFTQVLLWDWIPECKMWRVQHWELLDEKRPIWYTSSCPYMARLKNGSRVTYDYFRRTKTDYDPEREDGRFWPPEYRRGLKEQDK